jgi:hypothetical protein
MRFEKKLTGAFCAICGAAIACGGTHSIECKPRVEMCAPLAIHQPDAPHRDPAPIQTVQIIVAANTSTGTSRIVGGHYPDADEFFSSTVVRASE